MRVGNYRKKEIISGTPVSITRRTFLKYAAAVIATAAVTSVGTYYLKPPTVVEKTKTMTHTVEKTKTIEKTVTAAATTVTRTVTTTTTVPITTTMPTTTTVPPKPTLRKVGGEITVTVLSGWAVAKPVLDRLHEFEEATDIKVKVAPLPFREIKPKLLMEAEAGTGAYDVFCIYESLLPLFSKYTLPLDDFIKRDFGSVEAWAERLHPPMVEAVTYEGAVHYVPIHANIQWGAARRDWFEDPKEKEAFKAEYGYELKPPYTEKELIDVAKFFTRPEEGRWGLRIPGKWDHGACVWEFLMAQRLPYWKYNIYYDPETFKILFEPGMPGYEIAIRCAEFLQDLVLEHKVVPPEIVGEEMTEMVEAYKAGNTAMIFSWLSDYYVDIKEMFGGILAWTWPGPEETRGGWFGGPWALGISKDSANPEGAWEYLKWWNSEEIGRLHAPYTFYHPLKAVTEYQVKEGLVPKPVVEILKTAKAGMIGVPELDDCRDVIRGNIEKLYLGELTPKEFVDDSLEKIREILKPYRT